MNIPDSYKDLTPEHLHYFANHPGDIDKYSDLLECYLYLKTADLEVMTTDELTVFAHFDQILDDMRVMTHKIDDALLARAAGNREWVGQDSTLKADLTMYLSDKIIDGTPLSTVEKKLMWLFDGIKNIPEVSSADADDILDADSAAMEYGYDIYDYPAVLKRLSQLHDFPLERNQASPRLVYPLSKRETALIRRLWQIDPLDDRAVFEWLDSYQNDWLHPLMQPEHDARMHRYRDRQEKDA